LCRRRARLPFPCVSGADERCRRVPEEPGRQPQREVLYVCVRVRAGASEKRPNQDIGAARDVLAALPPVSTVIGWSTVMTIGAVLVASMIFGPSPQKRKSILTSG